MNRQQWWRCSIVTDTGTMDLLYRQAHAAYAVVPGLMREGMIPSDGFTLVVSSIAAAPTWVGS